MTDMELPARRVHLQAEGEPLILPPDMVTLMSRFASFASDSGLDGDELCCSPFVAMTMPAPGFTVKGSSVNADFCYHPLLWLPDHLLIRDGEDVDHWMLRVALEMSASGAYDEASGTWFDVMAHLGISVDFPEGRSRIDRWINGGRDEVLDNFSFGDLMDVDDPNWSYEIVDAMKPDLDIVVIARASASLLELVDDALNVDDSFFIESPDRRCHVATTAAVGAVTFLGNVGDDLEYDFPALRDEISELSPDGILAEGSAARTLREALARINDMTKDYEQEIVDDYEKNIAPYLNGEEPASESDDDES